MKWFAPCISDASRQAVARSLVPPLAATSQSKSLQAAERQRADVARARRRWIREQRLTPPTLYLLETMVLCVDAAALQAAY
jgi:hypothetical protein